MKHKKPSFGFLLPWSFDFQGGGVGHAVVGLVDQCLADESYCPIAIESDWSFEQPQEDQWRGITRIRLRLRPPVTEKRPLRAALSYLLNLPRDIYRLRRLINRHDIRVINSQFPGLESFNFVMMRRLRLCGTKTVFTFQGSDVRMVLQTRGLMRLVWSLMLRSVDELVFVSEGLKEEFLTFDPTLADRAVVVYNGVDAESFISRAAQPVPFPEFFSVADQIVLSVGGFEYRKGHDLLIKAFELVLRERDGVRLAIVGRSGPTLEATRKLIAERGLESQIALLADIPYDTVPSLLRRADVFVLCSRWKKGEMGEGFPLVLAESGVLARPTVSTESTGCDEIIRDGETGRLVALENPTAIAGAIVDLLNDHDGAQRMGLNLQKLVCERFTWRQAWQKMSQTS